MQESPADLLQRAKQLRIEDINNFQAGPIWAMIQVYLIGRIEVHRSTLEFERDAPPDYIRGQLNEARSFKEELPQMLIELIQENENERRAENID